jgi:hypothetical protein
MNGEHNVSQTLTRILDSHIEGLELEERGAFLRHDYSAARSKVLKKAPLKEGIRISARSAGKSTVRSGGATASVREPISKTAHTHTHSARET